MKMQNTVGRRGFVACCVCACCAGLAGAAEEPPKKTLRPLGGAGTAAKKTYDFAFCGIYCSACELRLKGGKDGKKCPGCTHPSMKSGCGIFACAKERKVTNCGLCEAFETCEKLKKHHEEKLYRKVARKNCERIKADGGMEKLAAEQKARWTCKSCAKIFYWNEGTDKCPSCRKPVDGLTEAEA
jgi:hypothetical protein